MMYKHVSFHPTSFCVSNFSSFPTLFTALKTTGRSITDFAEANKCHTQTHREESRMQEVPFHQKKQCHILWYFFRMWHPTLTSFRTLKSNIHIIFEKVKCSLMFFSDSALLHHCRHWKPIWFTSRLFSLTNFQSFTNDSEEASSTFSSMVNFEV